MASAPVGRSGRRPVGAWRGMGVAPVFVALSVVAVALFALPLVGLVWRAPWGDLGTQLASGRVLDALRLSLIASVAAAAASVVLGVPLAFVQARYEFRGRSVLRALTALPIVLPPVVGGMALLMAFGRGGFVGRWMDESFGVSLPFSLPGVIVAETFVAMPFLVLTMEGAFRSMDRRFEEAARTLGANPWRTFWRVTIPAVAPSLVAGAVLSWARALGEFGATIMFAGNVPGRTQTVPLAIFGLLEGGDLGGAVALSIVLAALSLIILISLRRHWLRTP